MAILTAWLLSPGLAHSEEEKTEAKEFDTEHIFGFTEGTNIGEKGEQEYENTSVLRFGKPGSYFAAQSESAFRDVVIDKFRVSVGGLLDAYAISDVPGLADRNVINFGGMTTEFRWHPLEQTKSWPVGVALSVAPQWQRIDEVSGATGESYAATAAFLADTAFIPDKLFGAINLYYTPGVTRVNAGWEHEDALEFSAAAAYAVTPDVLIGAEVRHLSSGRQGPFEERALFAGPSLYYKFSEKLAVKAAWSAQLPDETTHRLDLVNYERHQVILLLVKTF